MEGQWGGGVLAGGMSSLQSADSGATQGGCEARDWQRERVHRASEENQTSARVTLFPPTEGSWHPTS